jgi:hypothetical protein
VDLPAPLWEGNIMAWPFLLIAEAWTTEYPFISSLKRMKKSIT